MKETMEQIIERATSQRVPTLWGQEYPEYKPCLCETILGDGLQLVYLWTTDNRPYHWLIRIDSNTDVNANDFNFEDILQPIEEEFGRCDGNCECNETGNLCEYPIVCWYGGGWGVIANLGTGEGAKNFQDNIF